MGVREEGAGEGHLLEEVWGARACQGEQNDASSVASLGVEGGYFGYKEESSRGALQEEEGGKGSQTTGIAVQRRATARGAVYREKGL